MHFCSITTYRKGTKRTNRATKRDMKINRWNRTTFFLHCFGGSPISGITYFTAQWNLTGALCGLLSASEKISLYMYVYLHAALAPCLVWSEPDQYTAWSVVSFRKYMLRLLRVGFGRNPTDPLEGLLSASENICCICFVFGLVGAWR